MTKTEQAALAERFRAMHQAPPLLLLPNAWDAISARMIEAEGFRAVATTSAGVCWALGYPDGEQAPWPEIVAATARIARVVTAPVTADIEAGFGDTPEAVAGCVAQIIEAGAVGINLEDGTSKPGLPVRTIEDMAARIRAARAAASKAGVPIVINARTDLYLKNIGEPPARFADAVRRAEAYLAAGADCFYPMVVGDPETIAAFARAVKAPINILGRPGVPPAAELQRIGIARVSTAGGLPLIAYDAARDSVRRLRATGAFDDLTHAMTRVEAQELLAR
jgi:2-methylisocitrate lyase-like PEP mutase family enzyme